MADWFKFYEDFFDNPRFQYAIHQMSEVCPVTVLLLTEHCRHKSGSIRWSGDEIDLLGFSAKINVSPAKINEAIILLQRIRYITVDKGRITFLKWNDLQSDYCRKLSRKKASRVQKSPEKTRKVPRDETRREERRGENSNKGFGLDELKIAGNGKLEVELMESCRELLGESEMAKFHGRWYGRATKEPKRLESTLNDLRLAIKEGKVETTPAKYAEHRYKEFA